MALNLIADKYANTMLQVKNYSYMWTIDNFSLRREENGRQIKSPVFTAFANNSNLEFMLELYPKGWNKSCEKFISLYIKFFNVAKLEFKGNFRCSVINSKGDKTNGYNLEGIKINYTNERTGTNKYVSHNYLFNKDNGLLPNDKLTIYCEVALITDSITICNNPALKDVIAPECSLSEDFKMLLNNAEFTDVTLVIDEREFRAHKAILSARSDVFAAMFKHEMLESKLNRVAITDMRPEVLEEILNYIYTGKTVKLDSVAMDVLPAADKYNLGNLKLMCEKALLQNLSIESAVDTLQLADLYRSIELKGFAMDYINAHIIDIKKTEGWKNMLGSPLLIEVFEKIFGKNIPWNNEPPCKMMKFN